MKIKLLEDRVLVKPVEAETKTKAGIIVPTQAKERPNEGVIVSVGPGTKEYPMVVKKDDKVFYGKHSGVDIVQDEVTYIIMRQSDILAIL